MNVKEWGKIIQKPPQISAKKMHLNLFETTIPTRIKWSDLRRVLIGILQLNNYNYVKKRIPVNARQVLKSLWRDHPLLEIVPGQPDAKKNTKWCDIAN